jgi:hypothetical protein
MINRRATQNPCKSNGAYRDRTGDLRLTKPDSPFRGSPGLGGDSRREQAFHPSPCGDRRVLPGSSAALMQDACRMRLLSKTKTSVNLGFPSIITQTAYLRSHADRCRAQRGRDPGLLQAGCSWLLLRASDSTASHNAEVDLSFRQREPLEGSLCVGSLPSRGVASSRRAGACPSRGLGRLRLAQVTART